jgi:hypothetical protein
MLGLHGYGSTNWLRIAQRAMSAIE